MVSVRHETILARLRDGMAPEQVARISGTQATVLPPRPASSRPMRSVTGATAGRGETAHQGGRALREIEQQRQAEHTDDGAAGAARVPGAGPRSAAVGGVRQREVDHCVRPHHERLVDLLPHFGREDDDAVELLDPPEQVADLQVGVAVVRVRISVRLPNSASASSKSRTALLACAASRRPAEVLLGLADPLAHHRRQVDQ